MKTFACSKLLRGLAHVIAVWVLTCANAKYAFRTQEKEPFYDKSADVIVTALKCTAINMSSCEIDWRILGSGATSTKLSESFKLPGKIVTLVVTTTQSGCDSTLTLHINPDTPPGSLPSFQCFSRVSSKGESRDVVISSAMQPKQYVEIVPAVTETIGFLGNNATIRCPLANDLPPTAFGAMLVHWWHLDLSRKKAVSVDSFGFTLSIRNVTYADGGWYQCHPIGRGNTKTAENSSWVQLMVEGPPGAPVNFRQANSSCSNQTIEFVWDEPSGNVTAIEFNCSSQHFIIPYSALNPNHFLLNPMPGDGKCRIRFINPAGIGELSHTVSVRFCILEENVSMFVHVILWIALPAVAVALFVALLFLLLFFFRRRRVRRYVGCRRQSISESQPEAKIGVQEPNKILGICKKISGDVQKIRVDMREIRGDVREISDRGADNTSNALSGASSATMSSREEIPQAQAWRGGGYCKGKEKEKEEKQESDV
ncbi:uncharacterized protein [Oscarella lobularis]|uniref:uncharacterized protein n=1 Tax=Oscarella lobularis TaxID=121494 RepID=UPI0033142975